MDVRAIWDEAARVFNTTALGMGVLIGFYLLWEGYYLRAGAIFFIMVPVYFYLDKRFGPDQ